MRENWRNNENLGESLGKWDDQGKNLGESEGK